MACHVRSYEPSTGEGAQGSFLRGPRRALAAHGSGGSPATSGKARAASTRNAYSPARATPELIASGSPEEKEAVIVRGASQWRKTLFAYERQGSRWPAESRCW